MRPCPSLDAAGSRRRSSWATGSSLSTVAGGRRPRSPTRDCDFSRLEAVFLTHLHADHVGDLPGMLLYGWGVRAGDDGPLPPIRVYGPPRPRLLPDGDAAFHRETTIHPERPAPGTADLVDSLLAGYAYHLNVMPLDARMPDPGALVRAIDIPVPRPDGRPPSGPADRHGG